MNYSAHYEKLIVRARTRILVGYNAEVKRGLVKAEKIIAAWKKDDFRLRDAALAQKKK